MKAAVSFLVFMSISSASGVCNPQENIEIGKLNEEMKPIAYKCVDDIVNPRARPTKDPPIPILPVNPDMCNVTSCREYIISMRDVIDILPECAQPLVIDRQEDEVARWNKQCNDTLAPLNPPKNATTPPINATTMESPDSAGVVTASKIGLMVMLPFSVSLLVSWF